MIQARARPMKTIFNRLVAIIILSLSLALSACGGGDKSNTFTVTSSAGIGGVISPPGTQSVAEGGTAQLTITANKGFVIDSVDGCWGAISGDKFTTGKITSDCTVTASFRELPVVHVSVQAADSYGNALGYMWRVTDGQVLLENGNSIDWRLPAGPGLHFAYVLVGNNKGGYTERRIAVNTDTLGFSKQIPSSQIYSAPINFKDPTESYRTVTRYGTVSNISEVNGVYTPDALVYLKNIGTLEQTKIFQSDARGIVNASGLDPNADYLVFDSPEAGIGLLNLGNDVSPSGESINNAFGDHDNDGGRNSYSGALMLADDTPCGTVNEFFGVETTAKVSMLDINGNVIEGPYRMSVYGQYSLSDVLGAASIKFECENADPVILPIDHGVADNYSAVIANSANPNVLAMKATLGVSQVGIFLPPPSGVPSDEVPLEEFFLSAKGIDSKESACKYYEAIGAIAGCDSSNEYIDPISFEDWLKTVKMDPYAINGRHDITATYINHVDLNLTRNHHSLSYGQDHTAAYVCNYLGPGDNQQSTINQVITNATNGKNLVACVAMDYMISSGVNSDQPFVRFLIFGPDGSLLPSVNLDGRREKFVPGVCVACHGGDNYAGQFPVDGTGQANIGAHFLPYDSGNFLFSDNTGYTKQDQEESIYQLNQNVLNTGPNVATQELVAGWYATGHQLDENYLPVSWQGRPQTSIDFYQKVYARDCRTCHVAFTEGLNFDHYQNMELAYQSDVLGQSIVTTPQHEAGIYRTDLAVCANNDPSFSWLRNLSMPNSLNTFNLFWNSVGTPNDLPSITSNFLSDMNGVLPGEIPCELHEPWVRGP